MAAVGRRQARHRRAGADYVIAHLPGCRRNLCWNWFWRDLQHGEVGKLCGEVNRLIGWPFVETSPAVHLAHRDLKGSQEGPEQHRRGFG